MIRVPRGFQRFLWKYLPQLSVVVESIRSRYYLGSKAGGDDVDWAFINKHISVEILLPVLYPCDKDLPPRTTASVLEKYKQEWGKENNVGNQTFIIFNAQFFPSSKAVETHLT